MESACSLVAFTNLISILPFYLMVLYTKQKITPENYIDFLLWIYVKYSTTINLRGVYWIGILKNYFRKKNLKDFKRLSWLAIYHSLKRPEGQLLNQLPICRLVLIVVYYFDMDDDWPRRSFEYVHYDNLCKFLNNFSPCILFCSNLYLICQYLEWVFSMLFDMY